MTLAKRIPDNIHIIVASRDRFLSGGAVVGLGGKLHQITVDHLRLNHTELSIYSNLCGTELNDRQIESLLHSSEGWFSAVYLTFVPSQNGASCRMIIPIFMKCFQLQ